MNPTACFGISNIKSLDLDDLSTEKAYEFLFAWASLKQAPPARLEIRSQAGNFSCRAR
jgi:hypothetical protein